MVNSVVTEKGSAMRTYRCFTIRRLLRASRPAFLSSFFSLFALSIRVYLSPAIARGTPHRRPATTQDESLEMQLAVRSLSDVPVVDN